MNIGSFLFVKFDINSRGENIFCGFSKIGE